MSWFLGYSGKTNEKTDQFFNSLKLEDHKCITFPAGKIFYGSNAGNILHNFDDNGGTLICGILLNNSVSKDRSILNELVHNTTIDGHYAGINISGDEVLLFNDILGLRDIYYIHLEENTIFSTRIDYLAAYLETIDIDLMEFASLWMLPHKISWGSILKGINKLGPGGCLRIKNNQHHFTRKLWGWNKQPSQPELFIDSLSKAALNPSGQNKPINLGLSGGIDSRVLLQVLCSSGYTNWATHTFGPKDLPDVELSKRITDDLKIKHFFLEQFPVNCSDILNNKLYPQLQLSSPVAGMINYSFFEFLHGKGYTIIDGGNGEIFRRAFLNRFLLTAKDVLMNRDIPGIYSHLQREKADIFTKDVRDELINYSHQALSKLMDEMESPGDTGAELWLDLFFIKTKAANISGPSQAILDNISVSFMPFVQLSVMNAGFSLDPSQRNNGRLLMNIIKEGKANLQKFPLVKDNIYYPFNTGLFASRVIQKIKRKLGLLYKDNSRYNTLLTLKEYAKDKLNSQEVKSYSLYDYKKVSSLVNGFYDENKTELTSQLNWWLSFEIWREGIKKNE